MLHKVQLLKQRNSDLQRELQELKSTNQEALSAAKVWEEKYESLKLAESMLGSETNKREAKLKINALIRELDHCIVQLSE